MNMVVLLLCLCSVDTPSSPALNSDEGLGRISVDAEAFLKMTDRNIRLHKENDELKKKNESLEKANGAFEKAKAFYITVIIVISLVTLVLAVLVVILGRSLPRFGG